MATSAPSKGDRSSRIGDRVADVASPVSTGKLPLPDRVQALMYEAHERFKSNDDGEIANYYPAMSAVPGICLGSASRGPTAHSMPSGTPTFRSRS
jgi:hypothetical protein